MVRAELAVVGPTGVVLRQRRCRCGCLRLRARPRGTMPARTLRPMTLSSPVAHAAGAEQWLVEKETLAIPGFVVVADVLDEQGLQVSLGHDEEGTASTISSVRTLGPPRRREVAFSLPATSTTTQPPAPGPPAPQAAHATAADAPCVASHPGRSDSRHDPHRSGAINSWCRRASLRG